MSLTRVARAAAVGAFALLSAACTLEAPTAATATWRDPTLPAVAVRSVLVVGQRLMEGQRRTIEDRFVSALRSRGVRATPSYALLPDARGHDEAHSLLERLGVDCVLTTTARGILEAPAAEGGFWDGYEGEGWGGPYAPPRVVTDQFVTFETDLRDPQNPTRLIWSVITQTENPASGADFASSLVDKVLSALTQAGWLPSSASTGRVSRNTRQSLPDR